MTLFVRFRVLAILIAVSGIPVLAWSYSHWFQKCFSEPYDVGLSCPSECSNGPSCDGFTYYPYSCKTFIFAICNGPTTHTVNTIYQTNICVLPLCQCLDDPTRPDTPYTFVTSGCIP
jgi:hypothetical protein